MAHLTTKKGDLHNKLRIEKNSPVQVMKKFEVKLEEGEGGVLVQLKLELGQDLGFHFQHLKSIDRFGGPVELGLPFSLLCHINCKLNSLVLKL